jgi:hypothetical protein
VARTVAVSRVRATVSARKGLGRLNRIEKDEGSVAHKLVIVESPGKISKIRDYLGKGYVVEASIGHIRDLPQSAADTPAKIKDKPWGRMAVDVDNDFTPYYVVPGHKSRDHPQTQRLGQGRRRALPRHR